MLEAERAARCGQDKGDGTIAQGVDGREQMPCGQIDPNVLEIVNEAAPRSHHRLAAGGDLAAPRRGEHSASVAVEEKVAPTLKKALSVTLCHHHELGRAEKFLTRSRL